jgi:mono/diheme cytochrome c family protein
MFLMQKLCFKLAYFSILAFIALIATFSGCVSDKNKRKRQDFARGKLLYQKHCQNCHKADGEGFKRLYPPLKQVPYMNKNPEWVACIIKYGMDGPLSIKGKDYNLYMPGNSELSDYRIAQVMTYIYNAWGNNHERFTQEYIVNSLKGCDTTIQANK